MGQPRRRTDSRPTPAARRSRPRAADRFDAAAPSPVADQHAALEQAFAEVPALRRAERFNPLVQLAIVLGGSVFFWAAILGGGARLLALARG